MLPSKRSIGIGIMVVVGVWGTRNDADKLKAWTAEQS